MARPDSQKLLSAAGLTESQDDHLPNDTKELPLTDGALDYHPVMEICARFNVLAAVEQLDLYRLLPPPQDNGGTATTEM